jgi:DNA-directed RNA polymerase specialized sigma24 family protein
MRDQQGFADFAAAESATLRRQAYLLTGSVQRAEQVVARALAETGKRWSRLGGTAAAEEHARRLVAAGAVRSRGAVPAVALTSLGTALPTDDAGEAVWRALAGLPPRRRAVLVLRYDEGLSDAAVADRLGLPAATVAAEGESGLAALRSLLRRRGRPEDLLPAALATRTADLPPAPDPTGAAVPGVGGAAGPGAAGVAGPGVGGVADPGGAGVGVGGSGVDQIESGTGFRVGRRRWGIVAAGIVAVAAIVVAVVTGSRDDPVTPGAATGPVPARQPAADGELMPWAARGPLTRDDGLLRDALRRWQDGVPERQRPTTAAVLYAGAPDGDRTVLLQGTDSTGQAWVAEVTDAGGTLALRTSEPLGRTVPLLALTADDHTRLLAPPPDPAGSRITLQARDPAGALRPLTLDADGLSEAVAVPAAGLPVAVTLGDVVAAGSGRVLPGRLSAVTGEVELAPGTIDLGRSAVTTTWYDDGGLLARKLGGAVTVAGLGPVRRVTLRGPGGGRKVEVRAYEAVYAGTRYLATVVRVDGKPACVAAAATAAGPPLLVSRCLPSRATEGMVAAVGGGGIRSVRVALPAPAKGKPGQVVTVGGSSVSGLVGVARVAGRPVAAGRVEARDIRGRVVARRTLPLYRGPQL